MDKLQPTGYSEVLVWRHKYGSSLYSASTPQELEASARAVIVELLSARWIEDPGKLEDTYGWDAEVAALTEEQVTALPSSIRAEVESKRDAMEELQEDFEYEVESYQELVAIAEGREDAPSAWAALQERDSRGMEYESYSLQRLYSYLPKG